MPYRYRILGTAQVLRDDGTAVPIGGARLRALLASLAMRAGRTVPVGVLVREVWADAAPPSDAPAALQALVGRLRRVLGRAAIATEDGGGGGYRLCVEAESVDVHRFERLLEEGTRALSGGDAVRAAALLDEALRLWRGPSLADLPESVAAVRRTAAQRLAARRLRYEAELELGRAERMLPELAEVCAAHPLDEPLQHLRLRALRAAGRTAEALEAYESVRRTIADALGVDPGPELRALHAELLAAPRPGLGPGPGPRPGPAPADRTASDPGTTAPSTAAPGTAAPVVSGPGASAGENGEPAERPRPRPEAAGGTPSGRRPVAVPASALGAGRPESVDQPAPTDQSRTTDRARPTDRSEFTDRPDAPLARDPAPPARPRLTGNGSGPLPAGASAGASAGAVAGRLPARLTSFVGREDDLEAIRADLARSRLVTLLGPGGAGKTRLSQEVAEAVAGDWPDGIWFAELAPVSESTAVDEAVLTALHGHATVIWGTSTEGLRASDPADTHPLTRLVERCAPRRMLLVLDNCEHVLDGAAHLVETLLTRCPEVTVLATSREPLAVPGESVRPVGPLPEPVALRLLADRGAAARPGFRIEDDPTACAEICRRLDGLPLAVELAAARLRSLTPRQLAGRLDDRFRLLTSGSRTVLPRQQTLRAVVDWSWDLLDEAERAVLRRLSVFSGGCDLSAAEAVCGEPPGATGAAAPGKAAAGTEAAGTEAAGAAAAGVAAAGAAPEEPAPQELAPLNRVDPRDVPALLASLVDKSLVDAGVVAGGEMRYRLLETVREYAREKLEEAGERSVTERRHQVAYRELARATDPLLRGPRQREGLDRLEREHENLRAALARAVAAEDEPEALSLLLSLAWFWQLRNHRSDLRIWTSAVSRLGPDPFAPPVAPAPDLYVLPVDVPPPWSTELLLEARREARILAVNCLQVPPSEPAGEEGPRMTLLRAVVSAYRPGQPQTLRTPGSEWLYAVLMAEGYLGFAHVLDVAVDRCRELGLTWELASTLQVRARMNHERGDRQEQTRRDADEALRLFTQLGDAWGIAEALSCRGEALELRGAYHQAAEDFRRAVETARELGAEAQVPVLRARLAGALIEAGEGETGERMLREVLAAARQPDSEERLFARVILAARRATVGDTVEARELLNLVLREFRHWVPELFLGMVQGQLSWLDVLDGRPADGLARSREALSKVQGKVGEIIAPDMPVRQLLGFAHVLAVLDRPGDAERAVRLLGAHGALLPSVIHLSAAERQRRAATEDLTRSSLGDAAYERAHREGAALSIEEAVALADGAPPAGSPLDRA